MTDTPKLQIVDLPELDLIVLECETGPWDIAGGDIDNPITEEQAHNVIRVYRLMRDLIQSGQVQILTDNVGTWQAQTMRPSA
jgi:hypothetical protein